MSALQDFEVLQGGLPCPESVMDELKLAMKGKHYVACIVCSKPATHKCKECNETLYCSAECFVHDEPIHERFCGKPKAHSPFFKKLCNRTGCEAVLLGHIAKEGSSPMFVCGGGHLEPGPCQGPNLCPVPCCTKSGGVVGHCHYICLEHGEFLFDVSPSCVEYQNVPQLFKVEFDDADAKREIAWKRLTEKLNGRR